MSIPEVHRPFGAFVAMSRFAVAEGFREPVVAAFRARPGLVDQAPGFRRMDVLSPSDAPNEFWLLTYWDDEVSFQAWHKSHAFKESHQALPAGLKLDQGSAKLRFLTQVTS